MDEYRQYAATARTIGVRVDFLTPEQVRELWPLCNVDGLVGAIHHPEDGYVQPADLTQALAKGARGEGAEIHRRTRVTAIERCAGEWLVRTTGGDIRCEHVVSATGSYARATGAMVGLDVPVLPVEHQFIVTEPHPEVLARHAAGRPEMGVLRESDGSWYLREERGRFHLGSLRAGCALLLRRCPGGRRGVRTLRPRPGAADPTHRSGHEPSAGLCRSGRQGGVQRRHSLHSGRQPHRRPGLGAAQLLAERGP